MHAVYLFCPKWAVFFLLSLFFIVKNLGLSKQLKKELGYCKLHYKYENFKGERWLLLKLLESEGQYFYFFYYYYFFLYLGFIHLIFLQNINDLSHFSWDNCNKTELQNVYSSCASLSLFLLMCYFTLSPPLTKQHRHSAKSVLTLFPVIKCRTQPGNGRERQAQWLFAQCEGRPNNSLVSLSLFIWRRDFRKRCKWLAVGESREEEAMSLQQIPTLRAGKRIPLQHVPDSRAPPGD